MLDHSINYPYEIISDFLTGIGYKKHGSIRGQERWTKGNNYIDFPFQKTTFPPSMVDYIIKKTGKTYLDFMLYYPVSYQQQQTNSVNQTAVQEEE